MEFFLVAPIALKIIIALVAILFLARTEEGCPHPNVVATHDGKLKNQTGGIKRENNF
jgi:hypothetical protein